MECLTFDCWPLYSSFCDRKDNTGRVISFSVLVTSLNMPMGVCNWLTNNSRQSGIGGFWFLFVTSCHWKEWVRLLSYLCVKLSTSVHLLAASVGERVCTCYVRGTCWCKIDGDDTVHSTLTSQISKQPSFPLYAYKCHHISSKTRNGSWDNLLYAGVLSSLLFRRSTTVIMPECFTSDCRRVPTPATHIGHPAPK